MGCATSFRVGKSASQVFRIMQRLSISGSLDPGCQVCWSRPLDTEGTTFLRYLIFSKWFMNRDFFCVCRCGRVSGSNVAGLVAGHDSSGSKASEDADVAGSEGTVSRPCGTTSDKTQDVAGSERYVFAVMSPGADLLTSSGLVQPTDGIRHGSIYVCGIAVTGIRDGESQVDVMADV